MACRIFRPVHPLIRVLSRLSEILCDILLLEPDELAIKKTFWELGLDSISSLDFVTAINETFALELKTAALYKQTSTEDLARYLYARLEQ